MKSKQNIQKLRQNLLLWYRRHARDLPWRRTRDPYRIWVSEIMLQQTQVATVIPYYQAWVKRFPSLKAFAEAKTAEIMRAWAGLGYYRRVRHFHAAAKHILKNLDGRIPQTAQDLVRLPGIGKYTAGAIASIAFDEKSPVLDGNVIRILTRIFGIKSNVDLQAAKNHLWRLAAELLPDKTPGDFNQAMMELGATVCYPQNPSCNACPVHRHCAAHRQRRETDYPVQSRRQKIKKLSAAAVLFYRNGKVFIQKQPPHARWGSLWTFPFRFKNHPDFKDIRILTRKERFRFTIPYHFTHHTIQLDVYESHPRQQPINGGMRSRWVKLSELKKYAFPSPHRKIALKLINP